MTQASPPSPSRFVNSTAIYSVSMFLGRIASIVMLPVYTRYLSPADYGVLELIDVGMFAVAILIGMGLTGDALYYFHARAFSDEQRENLVNALMLSSIACSLAGGLAVVAGAGWVSEFLFHGRQYKTAIQIAGLTFISNMPGETCFSYLRLRDKPVAFMGFSLFRLGSNVILNIVFLVGFRLGFYSILMTSLLSSTFSLIGLLWYVYGKFIRWRMPDLSVMGPVVRYSLPLGLGGIGMLTINFGDRYFLSRSCSLSDIGIYSLAYKFGMMLTALNQPFIMFWRSQVHQIMLGGDEKGEIAFVRMFTAVAVIFGFAAYCLVVLAPLVMRVIAGPAFYGAAIFVPWVAASYLLRVLAAQLESGLLAGNKTKWLMASDWLAAGVCLSGYMVLIPRFKVWGAVAATFMAFLVNFVFIVAVSHRLKPRDFEVRKICAAYGVMIGLVLLDRILPPVPGLAGAAIKVALVPLALFLLALLPMFKEEQALLSGFLRRRLRAA